MTTLRQYEIVFIISSSFEDEAAREKAQEAKTLIEKIGAQVDRFEAWGKRKLAYEVKKEQYGYYFMTHFISDNEKLSEIERNFKLFEPIIKFIICRIDEKKYAQPSPFYVEKSSTETVVKEEA